MEFLVVANDFLVVGLNYLLVKKVSFMVVLSF